MPSAMAQTPLATRALVATQTPATQTSVTLPSAKLAMLELPDAPSASSSDIPSGAAAPALSAFDSVPQQAIASTTDKYILPGQSAPHLTVGDKILLGMKDAVSPFSMVGWGASALYAQALNGAPNYGTNGKAFAQRLGASAARSVSQGIFSDSIMSSIFHEDPRYYKMGSGHSILKRGVYAATRVIITRTDDGRKTPNFALLSGNLAGAALTNVYYPQANRTFSQTTETFAGSIGGSALGFVVSEFLSDTLELVHLKKSE
ncbi:MAG: hypothetical protein ABI072_01625 [Edaphobacter sp.]